MRLRLLVAALCAGILAGAPRVRAQHRERGGHRKGGPGPGYRKGGPGLGHCTVSPSAPLGFHPRHPPAHNPANSATPRGFLPILGLPEPSAVGAGFPKLPPILFRLKFWLPGCTRGPLPYVNPRRPLEADLSPLVHTRAGDSPSPAHPNPPRESALGPTQLDSLQGPQAQADSALVCIR